MIKINFKVSYHLTGFFKQNIDNKVNSNVNQYINKKLYCIIKQKHYIWVNYKTNQNIVSENINIKDNL